MIELQVIGPERVLYTARDACRPLGLPAVGVRRPQELERLLPPSAQGVHVTLIWWASPGVHGIAALAEHVARMRQRRPGAVLVGAPARPQGPVTVMLSSRPTGQKVERATPRLDRLPAQLGTSVVEVDGGPHTGLRRFLRSYGASLLQTGAVGRVTPLSLSDLLSEPRAGRLVFWRVEIETHRPIQLKAPAGISAELRDPRATAAFIHLRCPDRLPVAALQETAGAVEELVVDRADAMLTTSSHSSGLGSIEVHATVFRPSLAAKLANAMRHSRRRVFDGRDTKLGHPLERSEDLTRVAGRAASEPALSQVGAGSSRRGSGRLP